MKVSQLGTPTPPSVGQLLGAINPELYLIHHVTVVHIGGNLSNIHGELTKVTVFLPWAIIDQITIDIWVSQKTILNSMEQTVLGSLIV